MDPKLEAIIKAYLSPDKTKSLKAELAGVEDLQGLLDAANQASNDLYESKKDGVFTEEDTAQLKAITEVMKAAVDERKTQIAQQVKAQEAQSAIDELKSLKLPEAPKEDPAKTTTETETQDNAHAGSQPDEGGSSTQVPAPAEPADAAVQVPAAEAAPERELVTAGAPTQFSVASLPGNPPAPVAVRNGTYSSVFAVNGNGGGTDTRYETGNALVEALAETLRLYPSGMPGQGIKHKVAQYRRPANDQFSVIGDRDRDEETISRVANTPLKWDAQRGQFAAGWCAPEETLYELCPQISSSDGLWDGPTLQARRGSIQYTKGPDFATLYADASVGQILTEAQVEASTTKTCIEIDCPDFVTATLDVNPLCVTGNLLTHAGYPEWETRFIAEVMAANEHKINANIISRMVTASTLVPASGAIGTQPAFTGPLDSSAASQFLDYVSLYATWIRQQYRTLMTQVVEVVAPQWFQQTAAADLARRTGVDLLVASDRLNAALADRNIRVQWVYDWQMLAPTATTSAQLAAIANTRQATVQFLVYLPGTFVKLVNPVINLGVMHSAAQLATNQYTAMFVEEGFTIIDRCWQSLAVTIPICPSGTTGAASGSCDVASS